MLCDRQGSGLKRIQIQMWEGEMKTFLNIDQNLKVDVFLYCLKLLSQFVLGHFTTWKRKAGSIKRQEAAPVPPFSVCSERHHLGIQTLPQQRQTTSLRSGSLPTNSQLAGNYLELNEFIIKPSPRAKSCYITVYVFFSFSFPLPSPSWCLLPCLIKKKKM